MNVKKRAIFMFNIGNEKRLQITNFQRIVKEGDPAEYKATPSPDFSLLHVRYYK